MILKFQTIIKPLHFHFLGHRVKLLPILLFRDGRIKLLTRGGSGSVTEPTWQNRLPTEESRFGIIENRYRTEVVSVTEGW